MEIVLILDNIRSLYNVGSIFRSADAFGVSEIICSGYTPTPDHPETKKTALGAELTIKWRKEEANEAITRLTKEGFAIAALETGGTPLATHKPSKKIAVILGNETEGVSPELLNKVSATLSIDMRGKKESLNVSVATGILLYALTNRV